MAGIFDQILDHYEESEESGRLFLRDVIQGVTRKSVLKKILPSYIKEEDFLGETFLVMDEIARSGLPRKEKITKLFACSRFANVPQKSKLGLNNKMLYNLDTYDNDGTVLEEALVQREPEINSLMIALENSGLFSKKELQIVELMEQGLSFRQISKELGISPSYGWTVCSEIRNKLKNFKDSGVLEDDYNCKS